MKLLSPTPQKRINELIGLLLLSLGLVLLLSLASYHVQDPSLNTAAAARPHNLIGYPGAWFADLLLQGFGIGAFVFPDSAVRPGVEMGPLGRSGGGRHQAVRDAAAAAQPDGGGFLRAAADAVQRRDSDRRPAGHAAGALPDARAESHRRDSAHHHHADRFRLPGFDLHHVETGGLVRGAAAYS